MARVCRRGGRWRTILAAETTMTSEFGREDARLTRRASIVPTRLTKFKKGTRSLIVRAGYAHTPKRHCRQAAFQSRRSDPPASTPFRMSDGQEVARIDKQKSRGLLQTVSHSTSIRSWLGRSLSSVEGSEGWHSQCLIGSCSGRGARRAAMFAADFSRRLRT